MRKLYSFPLVIGLMLLIFTSCSKESQQEMVLTTPSTEVISASVAANSNYELKLDKYGSVKISRQATHFAESSTGLDNKTNTMVYKYVPQLNFRGDDEVMLSSSKTVTSYSGSGCNHGNSNELRTSTVTNYVTIKFRITD